MNKETFDEVMEEMIQNESQNLYEKELTEEELEDAKERVRGELFMLIQDKPNEMKNWYELIARNKEAEKEKTHYKVIWKNENAYRSDFKAVFVAKTHEDAKEYAMNNDVITEFDQYKIIKVEDGIENEIETIGEGQSINHPTPPPQDSSKNTDNN